MKIKLTLILSILLSTFLQSKNMIENGNPDYSSEFSSIIRIEMKNGASCSASLVGKNIILTAAHCITYFNDHSKDYTIEVLPGDRLIFGKVERVFIHPDYATQTYRGSDQYQINYAYDVAILEMSEMSLNQNAMRYLNIVNTNEHRYFKDQVQLIGYGTHQIDIENQFNTGQNFYSFYYDKYTRRIGINFLQNCNRCSLHEKQQLSSLNIETNFIQSISNGKESTYYGSSGVSMILPGDSGGPLVESLGDGRKVITGIASNITPLHHSEGSRFIIRYRNEIILSQNLNYKPTNWENNNIHWTNFSEITNAVIINSINIHASQLEVERLYKRKTIGRYANLLRYENQRFIKETINYIEDQRLENDIVFKYEYVPPKDQGNKPTNPQSQNKTELAHRINNQYCSVAEKSSKHSRVYYPYSCYCQFKDGLIQNPLIWRCYDISKPQDQNGVYPRIR